jgi:dipeptidyl aminopeptidase/acylaminoacyl peptidase
MNNNTDALLPYLNVRRAHGPSWSPDGTRVAFVADTSGLDQAWIVSVPAGDIPISEPQQVTRFDERVGVVSWSPAGDHLLVTVDAGGNEHDQLYLVPLGADGAVGEPRALTAEPDVIHTFGAWSPDGCSICYSCNRRDRGFFDVWVIDVASGAARPVFEADATLTPLVWSPDSASLMVSRANTNHDVDLFLVPLDNAGQQHDEPRLLTAHDGRGPAGETDYVSPVFSPDGRTLYLLANRGREFLAPAALDLQGVIPEIDGGQDARTPGNAGGDVAPSPIGAHAPLRYLATHQWDAEGGLALSPDGRRLAWAWNEDGLSRLAFYDLDAGRELPAPELPPGVVEGLAWAPDGRSVAFSFNGTRYNGNIWTAAPGADPARQVTHVPMGGLDPATLVEPERVRYTSFDGLEIPAYYYRPATTARASAAGSPVIVFVHGGPESQFRPLHAAPWMPPLQYYLSRGFAVFAPNVRGSSGYGKASMALDNIELRPNSVADLAAAVDWLTREGGADPARIGVVGRSYGGFMVLAAATSYPNLWAAAVDIVGIANFLSFFAHTGVWRRHLRAPEYGDPTRDAEFLRDLSPLFKAGRIEAPLLVLHGANDPRVPMGEAEQIVAAVRARGRPAELLLFPDEGHFMLRQSTQLTAYPAIGDWFERYMG